MRERQGAFFSMVLSVIFTVLISGYSAQAQTPSLPAVDVTFSNTEDTLQLAGYLYRPHGSAPFPAVVLLHGCGGIRPWQHRWAQTLQQWGYVALLVDSLGPRGKRHVCDYAATSVSPRYVRMPDAYAAKAYLARQPFVAPNHIAVMGWSHGGETVLYVIDNIYLEGIAAAPFQATIALYPKCSRLLKLNAPLLVLIGERDSSTPASFCQLMVRPGEPWRAQTAYGVTLKVYPKAYHAFDALFPLRLNDRGHLRGRHPEAAAQAEEEVKRFLARHLALKSQTP